MKRYELAKQQGLNWQVVLVTDAELDLKLLIRDCVLRNESLYTINGKVNAFIRDVVDKLENQSVKDKVKRTFPEYATRLYYKWLTVFGTQAMALAFMTALKAQGTKIPPKVEQTLKALPKTQISPVYGDNVELPEGAYNRAVANGIYPLEYEKQIQKRINEIADMTAKTNYADRYTLRRAVEIDLRAEHNQKQIQDIRDSGNKLAWIDTHANCSERCQFWQGKLYSLDGTSGVIDGVKYQPLENATEREDKYGYKNGCLSGFNCRHKLIPYKKGFRPIAIPERVMIHQRELEQTQRYMERTVRKYEARALVNKKGSKAYKHYKGLVKDWTERYVQFSKKNNIPFYPSRLDI